MRNTETTTCQNCKTDFAIEPDDFAFYEKMDVPPPTWCPPCRLVRRMTWRNETTLYRRECGMCHKPTITLYAADAPFRVYCHNCWISDAWNPEEYATDYDFNKDFFSQFRSLLEQVPLTTDMKGTMVNSEYGNYSGNCKNCYMCFTTVSGEDSCYTSASENVKESLDVTRLVNSELCYEAVEGERNYNCAFIERTRESSNSAFLVDCANVSDCFMSSNLKNARYVFRNEQRSPEAYKRERDAVDLGSSAIVEQLKREFVELRESAICRFAEVRNAINATGNNIINSSHVTSSFDVVDSKDVKYSIRIIASHNIYDSQGMVSGEFVYEGFGWGFSPRNSAFSFGVDASHDLQYSAMCRGSSDCFGCVGLKKKQYCIFNKQYTKEEYETLRAKIIAQMNERPYVDANGRSYSYGEFFPSELSPFAYNETIAQDYVPLTEESAKTLGFAWRDLGKRAYVATKQPGDIPDNIRDVSDVITDEIIACAHAGRCVDNCATAFKIVPEELRLYRAMNIALPRICPNCRYAERLRRRNPLALWSRRCTCNKSHPHHEGQCTNVFETSYAPDRPEIVYCEACYQAEVV